MEDYPYKNKAKSTEEHINIGYYSQADELAQAKDRIKKLETENFMLLQQIQKLVDAGNKMYFVLRSFVS